MLMAWMVVSCAAAGGDPVAAPVTTAAPSPAELTAERRAFWQDVRARGDAPPKGADVAALSLELIGYLGSTDPDVRDRMAYEVLASWIQRDGLMPRSAQRRIAEVLMERLGDRIGAASGDSVYGRSFSALVLAAIAAHEIATPAMSDAELTAMVQAARAYASKERDLRGHVEGRGWAHAAAHTADWLKFLSRNPRLGRERGQLVLEAVLDLTVRRHGHILSHGEDGRLAQPVMDLLRRDHIDAAAFSTWLERLLAPLHEKGDGSFDAGQYAAQRNARNLAFTLFVALSLEDARNPAQTASLAALTSALRQ